MRTNVNLLFYPKKRPTYKSGPVMIYLRFTIEGQRTEISTGKSIDPARWNAQSCRANGTKEAVKTLNAFLDRMEAKAQELHHLMTMNNDDVTAETLKNRFIGKVEKARTLVAVF